MALFGVLDVYGDQLGVTGKTLFNTHRRREAPPICIKQVKLPNDQPAGRILRINY